MSEQNDQGHGVRQIHIMNERGKPAVRISCHCGWQSPKRAMESQAFKDFQAHAASVK